MKRQLSIRSLLLLTVSMLTLLIVFSGAREVAMQWQRLEKVRSLRDATDLSDILFKAGESLSMERDIASSILYAPDTKTINELKPRLMEVRKDTDQMLVATLQAMKQYKFSGLVEMQHQINAYRASLTVLRQEIDQVLTLPYVRHETMAGRWHKAVTAQLAQMQAGWTQFIRNFVDINPAVTQHLRVKHLLRIITDYTGRERAIIGRLLVENDDPTPQEMVQLLRGQGVIELSWDMSNMLAAHSGLYPAVSAYYADARSHYSTMRDMLQDVFYIPGGRQGEAYPIGISLWLEMSAQAADSLALLKDITYKETRRAVEVLIEEARRAIFLHATLLVFGLGLCAYSFYVITRQVMRPINEIIGALIDITQGKPASLIPLASGRDDEIAKLVQVLHAFNESTERYKALIEASAQTIWTWRPGELGELDVLKQWWEEITGRPTIDFLPYGWLEALHPDDREPSRKTWSEASVQGRAFEMEYRLQARNGSYRHIYVRGVALKNVDGSVREFVGALQDVTEKKQAQQQIKESSDRLQAVFDTVLDGIITMDSRAIVLSFNLAAERIFGYKAEEVIGRNIKMLMPEPYHSEHDGYVHNYLTTSKPKIIGIGREVTAKRKDGSIFPMELGVSKFMAGHELTFVGIIRDISDRKQAESELLRYTRALERSNQELDDFAYIASHDLKEPLRGLFNHASFLLEDYREKLDEDGVHRLQRLSHLAQRMEHLVNDLLYFSRLGRAELAVQETDPNAIIEEIRQLSESFLKEHNASVIVPRPLPNIVCDRPRITEVFRNLITNAAKYNDKKDRLIEVGFLESATSPQGAEKNVFYVKDNGVGIEPEFYQEIFRIFKRLQQPAGEKEQGTGVGLTFVKKIIERHKGRIWLESEPGNGSTFYFTLERKDA